MFIKDCEKITTTVHAGKRFVFFHRAGDGYIDVDNDKCEYYGSFMSSGSFLNLYRKRGEDLNLDTNGVVDVF